jgi:hypothetical protein
MVLYPAVSLVSINPEGSHDHSARDARALAQGRLSAYLATLGCATSNPSLSSSPLLALEIASTGRAAADRHRAAGADPADEHREPTLGRAAYRAPYTGPNSLPGDGQLQSTWTTTAFLGVRIWNGGELYFNPELAQGFGRRASERSSG